ncbi:MAG: recombinase family protein [Myxococcales bacterium]|nr:recombinase family protein [Myxococcales bacterium]
MVIYCRVSTNDQSCERQEKELLAYAKRANFSVHSIIKEKISGLKNQNAERKKVMALAQAREIDCILVTELTRWGRSTIDLMQTINELQSWDVSLIAQTGFQFDVSTAQGKLLASLMSSLAEFERDLLRERVRSGLAIAKANGKKLGRQKGERPKSDKAAFRVMELFKAGQSYRKIASEVKLSKNTVMAIIRRNNFLKGNDILGFKPQLKKAA